MSKSGEIGVTQKEMTEALSKFSSEDLGKLVQKVLELWPPEKI